MVSTNDAAPKRVGTPAPVGAWQTTPLHGPWADVSLFGRRWPGPGRPASPATVAAVGAAGVVAALSVPLDRGGAGWAATAVAGVAALIAARAVPSRHAGPASLVPWQPRALGPERFGWSAATVALLSVGTVRAAGWLFVLCVLTALLTGALAVAGGRSARGVVLAALMTPFAGMRSLPWLARGASVLRRAGGGLRVTATVGVSVALLVVFGSLFASADAAFAGLVASVVPDIDVATLARWVFVFCVAACVLGGAAFLRAAPPELSGLDGPGKRRVARLEWAIPLSLLVLLFGLFVAVQLTVLFGGSRHVLDTDGLTYAQYARSGFWQLLVVTGLTLLVLAGAARWAPRETRTDRLLIRSVLGALAVLTLVVVASALHRMNVYSGTYGLTRLRVLVALCEVWLGVVFLLVLAAGVRLRAPWLPQAVVAAGVLALLGLAAVNPDRLIADRNVTRYEQTHRIDTAYLSNLSADAVPALNRLDGPHRDCALDPINRRLDQHPDDWRGWSLGREEARDVLAKNPPAFSLTCPRPYATE
ncbi:DUF4153 domain-containing protein [Nucisporomicrobium flavum]|uniref:DUF4153 domain-containing protein n=1 Tax=Nucisporomicrobium flavum TaxID=2785915 RepID=UPI0018F52683|nr:DUF4173 domain-containing protein [Nucisporomicrobium flavum]